MYVDLKNKYSVSFVIASLLVFHAINNYFILTASSFQSIPDSITYFKGACRLLSDIKIHTHNIWGVPLVAWQTLFSGMHDTRSPFFYLFALPFININMDMNWAIMSNMIYFGIFLFSVYSLGKELYDSLEVGILAVFLVSFFPGTFAMSRFYMRDFALAACLALNCYFFIKLLRSKGKNIFVMLFLTAFSIFAGLLVKEAYIYYLPLFPLFLCTRKEYNCKNNVAKIIFAIILGLAFSLTWYLQIDLRRFATWRRTVMGLETSGDMLFYVKRLYTIQLMPLFFALFVLSIIDYFRKKNTFILITVILPIAVFSFVSANKDGRFIMPLFMFIALAIAQTTWTFFTKGRKIIIATVLILSFLQYFSVTYGNGYFPAYAKLFPFPYENRWQNDGLYGIVKIDNYKKTALRILNLIEASCKSRRDAKDVNIIVLDRENELYWAMEEVLPGSGANMLYLERHYPDYNCDDLPLTGYSCKEDILAYNYVVSIRPPNFTWRNANNYYSNFIMNRKRFILVDTVANSPEVQFDIYEKKK
jgi:hypothetical protein